MSLDFRALLRKAGVLIRCQDSGSSDELWFDEAASLEGSCSEFEEVPASLALAAAALVSFSEAGGACKYSLSSAVGIASSKAGLASSTGSMLCEANTSSSIGRQTHSLLRLRLPCIGVACPSSASMTSLRLPRSASVAGASSSVSDGSSMTGVGAISTSFSANDTRLTGGNIRLALRADVADKCRLGKGLLRRMLCVPSGKT